MSLSAAALKIMADKGLTAHDIAEIAAANEKRGDPTAAERMRNMRARKKARTVTRNVTPEPPNDNTLTPGSEANASSPNTDFVLPADIPAEPWAAFERMRAKIKKPMTDDARKLAVSRLRKLRDDDGWPPGDVLNHCTMNSYQGIYPPQRAKRDGTQGGKSAAAYAMLNASPDEPF